jgi:hypothetical protein
MPKLGQLRSASHPGRAATYDRDAFAGLGRLISENPNPFFVGMIRGVTLKPSDFDRVTIAIEHHACAFAEDFGWTNSGTACAKDICSQDDPGRAGNIAARDLFDKCGNIDTGWAGRDAWGVETEKTA